MAYRMLLGRGVLVLLMSTVCSHSIASVVITGTRLVYPEKQKEITVSLNNKSESPVLVQTWMDNGDIHSKPSNAIAPFILSPPIFRMDANAAQSLRLRLTSQQLPKDKESVFYFNMLEVPATPDNADGENLLQMAFRSRIKVFYRPEKLEGDAGEAIGKLQWTLLQQGGKFVLQVYNPSPFYVSLTDVNVVDHNERFTATSDMVEPGARTDFALPTLKKAPGKQARVDIGAINDWGGYVSHTQALTP